MFSNSSSTPPPVGHQLRVIRRGVSKPQVHRASTKEAYAKDVTKFCASFGTMPHSADDLCSYIVLLAKRVAPATILRRCAAIQDAHLRAGHPSPTADPRVREALRWLASGQMPVNLLGAAKNGKVPSAIQVKARKAKPITRTLLTRLLDLGTGRRTIDYRNIAILLMAFAGFKRSAICALDIADIAFSADAMLVHVGLRVGDADGAPVSKGRVIAVPITSGPLCAASAVRRWIEHCDIAGTSGPLFVRFNRSGEPIWGQQLDSAWVNVILKERLLAAGVEDVSSFSAESLRKGHDLEAIKGGRR